MANDRMYIRCKGCGDLHYLAKCYDDGYFTTHEGEELRQGLDDFFDRHKWCYRDKYYGGFELVYESDEDSESEDEEIRKLLVWQVHRNIEDETNDLAQSVYDGIKGHDPDIEESIEDWKRCLAWLEKQKQQKPAEWSEEDEEMLEYVIGDLNDAKQLFSAKDAKDLCDKEIAWLKSLRNRPKSSDTWKPSEEQMAALEAATVRYQSTGLESLYEELKKL